MKNPRSLVVIAAASRIDDDGHQWIEVMPVVDKARNGPWYFTVTRDDLDTYAASIESQPGLIPIDYDHEGATGGSSAAAGWFTGETQIVETGDVNPAGETQARTSLWARAKWTPQGAQDVRDGRFKRLSPEFSFHEKDKKTGLMTKAKEIFASTLTNRPFFRELAPVATDGGVIWSPDDGFSSLQTEVYQAINGEGSTDPRYWVCDIATSLDRALVSSYGGDETWVVPFTRSSDGVEISPSSDWTPAEQQWVDTASEKATASRKTLPFNPLERNDMPAELKAIATELGLAEDATEEQVIAAVKAAKKLDVPADAVVLTQTEKDELVANAAAGLRASTELQGLKVTTKLEQAVRAGKITVAQKAGYEALAGVDFDTFVKTIDELPEGVFATKAAGHGVDNDDPDAIKPAEDIEIGGTAVAVDQDSNVLHVRAMKHLSEKGIDAPTGDQYANALKTVSATAA